MIGINISYSIRAAKQLGLGSSESELSLRVRIILPDSETIAELQYVAIANLMLKVMIRQLQLDCSCAGMISLACPIPLLSRTVLLCCPD